MRDVEIRLRAAERRQARLEEFTQAAEAEVREIELLLAALDPDDDQVLIADLSERIAALQSRLIRYRREVA
jgi:hypothetical protein